MWFFLLSIYCIIRFAIGISFSGASVNETRIVSPIPSIKSDPKPKGDQKPISKKDYHLITDPNEIDKWIEEAEEVGEVAVDTETTSLDPHQADLIGVSLCSKIGKACYIPVGHKSSKCMNKNTVIKTS